MGAVLPAIEDGDLPAHSLLGASGSYRWLACPGSFKLTRDLPPPPASVHAARGTLAHRYIEELFPEHTEVPDTELGRVIEVDGHAIEVDQKLIDGVDTMLGYLRRMGKVYSLARAEFLVSLDHYFRMLQKQPPVRLYGRCDLAMFAPERHHLEIVDYKNGVGILVIPDDNPQMLYYAAGVLALLAETEPSTVINTVTLTVVQPHARAQEKIRSWTISALDVLIWVDEVLIPGVARCSEPTAPLVPGSHCRFCSASFMCPALVNAANTLAKREFEERMPCGTPADLAEQLDLAEHVEVWINALRGYAVQQLTGHHAVPGWTLVPTRPTRRWKDPQVVGALLDRMGWDQGWRREPLSPGQMEKRFERGQGETTWQHHFAPLIERVSSGVKLARDPTSPAAKDFPENG